VTSSWSFILQIPTILMPYLHSGDLDTFITRLFEITAIYIYIHWLHVSACNQPFRSNRNWKYEWRGEIFSRRTRKLQDEAPWRGISLTYND